MAKISTKTGIEDVSEVEVNPATEDTLSSIDSAFNKTILQAKIDFSSSGNNTIVSADATKKIKVVSLRLTVAGETNLTFKRGGTAISGAMDFGGTGESRGMVDGGSVINPIIETGTNETFVINSSSAVQVSGWITYFKE